MVVSTDNLFLNFCILNGGFAVLYFSPQYFSLLLIYGDNSVGIKHIFNSLSAVVRNQNSDLKMLSFSACIPPGESINAPKLFFYGSLLTESIEVY